MHHTVALALTLCLYTSNNFHFFKKFLLSFACVFQCKTLASNWCRLRPFKSKKKKKKESNHEGLETQYRDRKKKGKSKRVRNRQIVVDRYGFMYRSTEDTVRCEMPFLHLMPSFSTYIYIYRLYGFLFIFPDCMGQQWQQQHKGSTGVGHAP